MASLGIFARLILGCVAASISVSAVAQGGPPRILNSFGNWRIELEPSNQSLRLVGVVTEGAPGYFDVICYASANWRAIFISIFNEGEREAALANKHAKVSVWNEAGNSEQLRMLTKEGHLAFALAKPELAGSKDIYERSALVFLERLNEARSFFAIELGGQSRTYDAKHLPAARARFNLLCEQARTNWSKFLSELSRD
jgi:hypothetical protein